MEGKPWDDIAKDRRVECNEALISDFNRRLKEIPPPQMGVDASATPCVQDVTVNAPEYGIAGVFGDYLVFPVSFTAIKSLDERKHGLFCRVLGPDRAVLEDCNIRLNVSADAGDKVSGTFQVCNHLGEFSSVKVCYRPPKE
jgi:hypothetical protein